MQILRNNNQGFPQMLPSDLKYTKDEFWCTVSVVKQLLHGCQGAILHYCVLIDFIVSSTNPSQLDATGNCCVFLARKSHQRQPSTSPNASASRRFCDSALKNMVDKPSVARAQFIMNIPYYRPFSLSSILCSILGHVLYPNIVNFLDGNSFSKAQHGSLCLVKHSWFLFIHKLHTILDHHSTADYFPRFCESF